MAIGAEAPGAMAAPDRQFEFAKHYLESNEPEKAVVEFERFLYLFPDDQQADSALHWLGRAQFQLGRYPDAIDSFGRHIRSNTDSGSIDVTPEVAASAWLASESYLKLGQGDRSVAILHRLLAETNDPNLEDETWFHIGWIHLKQKDWEKGKTAFRSMTASGQERRHVPEILLNLENADEIPQKSPKLAGVLSVIPGAGYLYLGRYQDAATAFLINAAFIGATWEAFDNGNEILGGLLGLVGVGFYSGNVYGSIASTHKYNQDQVDGFVKGLSSIAQCGVDMPLKLAKVQAFAGKEQVGVMMAITFW